MDKTNPQLQDGFRFPWRDGNDCHLLVDGEQFFPAMLQAIEQAERSVFLEMYLMESGTVASRFIHSLTAARARGVDVAMLLDDFGCRGLSRHDRELLSGAGVRLHFYNPLRTRNWMDNMARDHRKLLLVDGAVAFIGGAGLTDEFDPPLEPQLRWRETMVAIRGPVILDWQFLADEVWQQYGSGGLVLPEPQLPAGADMPGRVTVTRGRLRRGITRSLVRQVHRAQHRVWISTAYFVPTFTVRHALHLAARRGVDVRLLLPGPHTDHPAVRLAGRRFYTGLLRVGVRIIEYSPRVLHSKVVLCDDWVSVGSSNFDRWNLRWNLEANQEIEHAGFASRTADMLAADFAEGNEIEPQRWLHRSLLARLMERFFGTVDYWITRIGSGRRD